MSQPAYQPPQFPPTPQFPAAVPPVQQSAQPAVPQFQTPQFPVVQPAPGVVPQFTTPTFPTIGQTAPPVAAPAGGSSSAGRARRAAAAGQAGRNRKGQYEFSYFFTIIPAGLALFGLLGIVGPMVAPGLDFWATWVTPLSGYLGVAAPVLVLIGLAVAGPKFNKKQFVIMLPITILVAAAVAYFTWFAAPAGATEPPPAAPASSTAP